MKLSMLAKIAAISAPTFDPKLVFAQSNQKSEETIVLFHECCAIAMI